MNYQAAIFDLDGVLVDTAKYHYLAWKSLAEQLGLSFTQANNERLKGVSRMASLEILLEVGGLKSRFTDEQKQQMAERKNAIYVDYISKIDDSELLDGTLQVLSSLRSRHVLIALGSASKNAPLILKNTGIASCFDSIVDGNSVTKAKPDPEVFELGARRLGVDPHLCAVFEDSQAGLLAAKSAGMLAIGIGESTNLPAADVVFRNLMRFPVDQYF